MHFKQLNTKKSIFLFFLLTFQFNSFGQDFEWVYNILGTSNSGQNFHYSTISDVVIDNQDNIYILGLSQGEHDFTDGSGNIVINTENVPLQFIAKLDKNKNVLWVKHFNLSENVRNHISNLHLDPDQNLFLIGYISNFGVDFIDLDPDPSEQQTIVNPSLSPYGVIIKLNANGTYIDSWDFENYIIRDLAFDSEEEIIITATIWSENFGEPPYETAKVFKFDSNLNLIWTKVFDGFSIRANELIIDNLNGIIIKGTYKEFLIFDEENLQNENGNFICKLNPDGSDGWIIDLRTSVNSGSFQTSTFTPLYIDNNNNLYTTIRYRDNDSFKFKNTTLTGLPYINEDETVLFNFDSNGNYISHLTFSGSSLQNISSFAISEFNELIIGIRADNEIILRNSSNQEIGFLTTEGENVLLKISEEHQFIDYIEVDHMIGKLQFDSENNIIMGTIIFRDTDFDPHSINEYIVANSVDRSGYVLKLSYCDAFPPTGDDLIFCSDDNPTVADLEANEYNISWYSTLTSTVKLENNIPLQNGQTYYAKKNKEDHCPEIFGRLAVLVTINPTPPPPVLATIQPCYNTNFRLEDINIDGTNVDFFATLTTTIKLPESTIVDPNVTYYMSQTISDCESERVPFNFPSQSAVSVNNHTINLCDADKNNTEQVNLSNYISYLLNGNENDFTISYHNSQADAENGANPIQNFEEYQSNTQNIYVRFLYNDYSCYQIATLTINVSAPPEITEIITRDGTGTNNSITILPANPQYLYSIDGINYQSSNIFENILAGEYLVYVKDSLEACGEVTEQVYLLTYPKFFTPNGDGYNDFWKIKYAQFQFAVDVEIYDRYGKLITSFDKNSPGWDGKYNGENLPSTDYWFKVTRFIDKKVIHKGHFSLKR